MAVRIEILGAAGYTGGELIRLLINHPQAEIVVANSESNAGNRDYVQAERLSWELSLEGIVDRSTNIVGLNRLFVTYNEVTTTRKINTAVQARSKQADEANNEHHC